MIASVQILSTHVHADGGLHEIRITGMSRATS
jgi:hypothetical protein